MTLLIAYVLFAHFDFGFWAYFWTFWLWIVHLSWHHIAIDELVKCDLGILKARTDG